jgi:iron complex outermembrane receptor protein
VFGQGDYTWNNLTLTLGGRYTHERKTFDYFSTTAYQEGGRGNYGPYGDVITADEAQSVSNFTWRAALGYHFTTGVLGYASAATGFKSGDFNGGFLSSTPALALLQLKPILPEKVTAYEVGLKTTLFEHRLVLNGAVFYNDYKDEQVLTTQTIPDLTSGILTTLTNVNRSHTEGVEFDATTMPLPGLTIQVQPAWLSTRIDDAGPAIIPGPGSASSGDELANSPHFSFYGSINYTYPLQMGDDVSFLFSSRYQGHAYFDSSEDPYVAQNGYWLHNLSVTYHSHQRWDASFFVHNLSGTKYFTANFDYGSFLGLVGPTVGAPRTFGGRLAYHF